MKYINSSLITLKCVLFLFFGENRCIFIFLAIGSLFPFLPLHMDNTIGLSKDESVLVSIVAPLIALIGPLVAAPLADRLAGGFGGAPRSKTGQYLRVMITVCLILSTVFYWLLLAIPPIIRNPPEVTFVCDRQGGFVIQNRCAADNTCYNWGSFRGSVLVTNCTYACNSSLSSNSTPTEITTQFPDEEETTEFSGEVDFYGSGNGPVEPEPLVYKDYNQPGLGQIPLYIPPPHMCYRNVSGETVCEVFTKESRPINFKIGLEASVDDSEEEPCKYPISGEFECRIPEPVIENLTSYQEDCHPNIVCAIYEPYKTKNGLLSTSQCVNDNASFWLYLFIRSAGDIFTAAAVALLATAVVIATEKRLQSSKWSRGDVGKQFAAGALGFGIFAPIIGGIASSGSGANKYMFLDISLICFTVLMLVAALILLIDGNMPLSPPEWWWHTRCGLLALPMSSVRKYGLEIGALGIVLFLLGVFWNAIDSFLPWRVVYIEETQYLIIGLTITIAALPAVVFLIFAEKIVDYCGHSNILIFCFVNYICHHLALMYINTVGYFLLCEWMEMFTLHIMYITAVLYLRHLVPRKFTACGQALPIIAHFCLGRCFGALFGGMAFTENRNDFHIVHRAFTIAAAVVAVIYFVVYHFYMKPKCAAPMHLPPDPAPAVVQSMNGNGAYTPLRVYHNSKSKKGHFRY
ncbi:hypothetical protein NQ318_013003 [Aromia moschata]|uniref:Major facilitator superfamily associated domain-containing protein n=1 Tax=Aromia moschata TaxID=1265417 RepID=A0AAV8XVM2_9CUCU|nr:hypothetical protein NQ318_013003 [Aromia moschata]